MFDFDVWDLNSTLAFLAILTIGCLGALSLLLPLVGCGAMSPGNLTATAPPSVNHFVVLTWHPSSTAAVDAITYRVYRADVQAGPYSELSEVSATTYTDSNVQHKHTYFWEVTAVCKTCDPSESVPVGPVSGSIP